MVKRPLSPHLQVYRPQITSFTSIMHRASGVALSVGTLLMTWWLVAAATSEDAFATAQWFIGSPIGLLLLFGWTLALVYHFINGIRHLAWDAGVGFEAPQYRHTGYATLIGTVGVTLLLWLVGLVIW
ncbi:MAG: succinate dehydrogenase, cytochrome b556 subunit [Proteobacteria bacterium]|nr:succinate dehydrogenase, cytochrome b556 subunit [Pseudomonadota bacterium]